MAYSAPPPQYYQGAFYPNTLGLSLIFNPWTFPNFCKYLPYLFFWGGGVAIYTMAHQNLVKSARVRTITQCFNKTNFLL